MRLPGAGSLVILFWLFVLLPWSALRSARVVAAHRAAHGGALPVSRTSIWLSTLLVMALLLLFSWFVGRSFGYDAFAVPPLGVREYGLAVAALVTCLGLRLVARRMHRPEERRGLVVFAIAPRTADERALAIVVILVASVAEEVAYRGVAMNILWWSLGNPWLAAVACATAFALAHAVQGWKSGLVVFAIALVMHGLVASTGTLVLAMGVHAAYDLIAGHLIRAEALRLEAGEAGGAPA